MRYFELYKTNVAYIYLFSFMLFFKQAMPTIITPTIVFIVFTFYLIITKPPKIFNQLVVFNVIFILLNLFSILDSGRIAIINTMINNLIYIVIFTTIIKNRKDIDNTIFSFTLFGTLQCIFLYYKYGDLLGYGRFGEDMDDTTFSAITLSYYIVISLISSLIMLYCNKNKRIKLLSIVCIAIILTIALFTGSKKAIITPVLFVVVYNFIKNGKNFIKLVLSLLIIVVLLSYIWNYVKEIDLLQRNFVDRFESFFLMITGDTRIEDESTKERLKFIPYALSLFYNNPLFGTFGLGYAVELYLKNINVNHPHNTYLEILAGTGIIGFFIYYGVIIKILYGLKRIIYDNYAMILVSVMLAILFNQFNSQSYNVPVLNVYFSIAYSYLIIKKNENTVG